MLTIDEIFSASLENGTNIAVDYPVETLGFIILPTCPCHQTRLIGRNNNYQNRANAKGTD